jgi:hypothetical protein
MDFCLWVDLCRKWRKFRKFRGFRWFRWFGGFREFRKVRKVRKVNNWVVCVWVIITMLLIFKTKYV